MDSVNKTLYIPLHGKAYVSKKGILLHDPKTEEIWMAEGFPLKGKSKSKWLAYYMGMRTVVFDRWLQEKMDEMQNAVILHLGCGMDSRVERLGTQGHFWFDVDFPEVIAERKRYYRETETYHMLASDVRSSEWFQAIPENRPVLVIMEGISMYLTPTELALLMEQFKNGFADVSVLMDCYTEFAAKASKYKNPINDVGVTRVYGLNDPRTLGLAYLQEHDMTPADLVNQLGGMEKAIFKTLFTGSIAKKLYRIYEFSN